MSCNLLFTGKMCKLSQLAINPILISFLNLDSVEYHGNDMIQGKNCEKGNK